MTGRTDLALEAAEYQKLGEADGFLETVSTGAIPVSRVRIVTEEAERKTGKPIGRYATVFFDGAFSDDGLFDLAVDKTAEVIGEFLKGARNVLAIGLGNAEMTADALGPKVIDRLIVSRHLKHQMPDLYRDLSLGTLSALRPGVVGQTGIETAELIRSAVQSVSPDAILIFDALASRRLKRLCATVQVSDTGITPGSGVGNHRTPINRQTLGIPVISVGIPTVVDAATLTADALETVQKHAGNEIADGDDDQIRSILGAYENNLVVTPQDIDALVGRAAKLLSLAANKAIHTRLGREEIEALTGV